MSGEDLVEEPVERVCVLEERAGAVLVERVEVLVRPVLSVVLTVVRVVPLVLTRVLTVVVFG